MLKSIFRPSFKKISQKLSNLKRTIGSTSQITRQKEFDQHRLSASRTVKYSKRRKTSFLTHFEEDMFWTLNLDKISERHGVNYKQLIQNTIAKSNTKGKKAVIVEFGPGEGRAIHQASIESKGRAEFFGYADLADKKWVGHNKVKYIQDAAEGFRRHFKENSIDFLFSHLGLAHAELKFDSIVGNILPCIKVGGVLKTDVFPNIKSKIDLASRNEPKIISFGKMSFRVENTSYEFFGKADDFARVLTFTRVK